MIRKSLSTLALCSGLLLGCGSAGTQGQTGPTGLVGPEGPVGPMGPMGSDGTPGAMGTPGVMGADGTNYQPVTALKMNGWQLSTIQTAKSSIVASAATAWPYNFNDPKAGSAVLDTGSGDGANQGGKAYAGFSSLNYLPIQRLTQIKWHTYAPGPAPNINATGSGYWDMYIVPDPANPAVYDHIIIDPAYFPAPGYETKPDVWQTWIADGNTKVRCRYQKLKIGPNAADLCNKNTTTGDALSLYQQYNPGAVFLPAYCGEIPYALPNGQACDPASTTLNMQAPAINFEIGQASGGLFKDTKVYLNGVSFLVDDYSWQFIFRG